MRSPKLAPLVSHAKWMAGFLGLRPLGSNRLLAVVVNLSLRLTLVGTSTIDAVLFVLRRGIAIAALCMFEYSQALVGVNSAAKLGVPFQLR
jgi:hypothetical protein